MVSQSQTFGPFEFECGESIPELTLAYETYGEFTGDNAVLVCHALTGSAHVTGRGTEATAGQAAGWWDAVIGPGKAIDTNEYFVVSVNVPGSCYGSTGPSSENPETGEPYGTDFPAVTVGDWTRAQRQLLDEIGVGRIHAIIGGSVGGMNVLDWGARYPDDANLLIPVAAAARLDAQSLGLDAIARRAITMDPHWNDGAYYGDDQPDPTYGLGLARQLGHVMYLSKASMEAKFGRRTSGRTEFRDTYPADPGSQYFPYREVESYLDYQAEKFVDRFDANSYLYMLRAMDNYDLAAGYDSDTDALAAFSGEALVLSFTGDWHFTVEQSQQLADAFRDASVPVVHHAIESDHGHDAFLVEPEKVGPPVSGFLEAGVHGRAVTETGDHFERDAFDPIHTGQSFED